MQTHDVATTSAESSENQHDSAVTFQTVMRPHIALATRDLAQSTRFYAALFDQEPTKTRPGYAKFEVAQPPLNLSLNHAAQAQPHAGPAHFGVQVKSTAAVLAVTERLKKAGIRTETEEHVTCCYAVQDKVWAVDPDGMRWEVFVVLDADAEEHGGLSEKVSASLAACCEPTDPPCCDATTKEATVAATGCCG